MCILNLSGRLLTLGIISVCTCALVVDRAQVAQNGDSWRFRCRHDAGRLDGNGGRTLERDDRIGMHQRQVDPQA